MKAFQYLAALALACSSTAVEAQIVQYGVVFDRTYFWADPRLGTLEQFPRNWVNPDGGHFTFDTDTDQLLSFNALVMHALSYRDANGQMILTPDPVSTLVIQLFDAAGPCDLQCFIDTLNASTWSNDWSGVASLELAAPLNGSVDGYYPYDHPFGYGFGGNVRVTGPVPEPATWAMMLMGFGAIGYALRRNRRRSILLAQCDV